MKILVSGFEPWGDRESNPSGDVAASLEGERIAGAEIVTVVLPVLYGEDTAVLFPLIERIQPAAVVSLGLSGRPCLSVERVAVNLKQDDEPIEVGGPDAYFATLPTRSMVEEIEAGGIPAQLSYHAGRFLCNHIMYSVLHHLAKSKSSVPAGFIHVPPTPDLIAGKGQASPSMSLEMIREGTVLGIENLVSCLHNV